MALPNNSAYIPFLRFLQARQRETHKAHVDWREALDYLGLTIQDQKDYHAFIEPLEQAKLVYAGIASISLLLAGEEYILAPDERAAQTAMREQLLSMLEGEIAAQASHTVELAHIVEAVTGTSSSSGVKAFSSTRDLARRMNVDPYALRTVALRLVHDNLAETMGGGHQDEVTLRLRPRDIKALLEAHSVAYEQGGA